MSSTIRITPSQNLPIMHEIPATSVRPGFQATLFVKRPSESFSTDFIYKHTVYLHATLPGTDGFDEFDKVIETALCVPIQVYLDLLQFFADEWATVEAKMNQWIRHIRNLALPEEPGKNYVVHLDGTVEYQLWFSDVFFMCRQYSQDACASPFFHLQRAGVSMQINPVVMRTLASELNNLRKTLSNAGYQFPLMSADDNIDSD
jgi:hypothetical protein